MILIVATFFVGVVVTLVTTSWYVVRLIRALDSIVETAMGAIPPTGSPEQESACVRPKEFTVQTLIDMRDPAGEYEWLLRKFACEECGNVWDMVEAFTAPDEELFCGFCGEPVELTSEQFVQGNTAVEQHVLRF